METRDAAERAAGAAEASPPLAEPAAPALPPVTYAYPSLQPSVAITHMLPAAANEEPALRAPTASLRYGGCALRSIETVEAAMRPIAASSLRWPPTHFEGRSAPKEDKTAEP